MWECMWRSRNAAENLFLSFSPLWCMYVCTRFNSCMLLRILLKIARHIYIHTYKPMYTHVCIHTLKSFKYSATCERTELSMSLARHIHTNTQNIHTYVYTYLKDVQILRHLWAHRVVHESCTLICHPAMDTTTSTKNPTDVLYVCMYVSENMYIYICWYASQLPALGWPIKIKQMFCMHACMRVNMWKV